MTAPSPSEAEVVQALTNVIDPELGFDLIELGLIYDVAVADDGEVVVLYSLTSPGCPAGEQLRVEIEQFVWELPGVSGVEPRLTSSPPWTLERISDDLRFAMGL